MTLQALEASAVGTLVRESLYGFPILVTLHLIGLALSIAPLLWFDLRLTGVALATEPVSRVYRQVIPWAATGFVVAGVTGVLLFVGYASSAAANPYFWTKLAALLLAGANAAFYHAFTKRTRSAWDTRAVPSPAARAAGVISIVCWATVILCGRMMAYTMY